MRRFLDYFVCLFVCFSANQAEIALSKKSVVDSDAGNKNGARAVANQKRMQKKKEPR